MKPVQLAQVSYSKGNMTLELKYNTCLLIKALSHSQQYFSHVRAPHRGRESKKNGIH